MNLLGKIFTMLIFVMSIVFMSLALTVVATHKNWKKAADNANPTEPGLKQQLDLSQAKNAQLLAEIEQWKTRYAAELGARAYALAALESQLEIGTTKWGEQVKELQGLQALASDNVAKLTTSIGETLALNKQVEDLRATIRTAQQDRDKMFQQVVATTDKTHEALDHQRVLGERNEQLLAQNAKMRFVLDVHGLTSEMYVSANAPPPALDGVVLAVGSQDLLEISLGWDDGLREGHTLEVFRGALYLGKATVMKVAPNRAVAKLLSEYKRGPIRKDDRVTTKLGKQLG